MLRGEVGARALGPKEAAPQEHMRRERGALAQHVGEWGVAPEWEKSGT